MTDEYTKRLHDTWDKGEREFANLFKEGDIVKYEAGRRSNEWIYSRVLQIEGRCITLEPDPLGKPGPNKWYAGILRDLRLTKEESLNRGRTLKEVIITVTKYGDKIIVGSKDIKIRETHFNFGYTNVGKHSICGGIIVCRHISDSHQALICKECNLRIAFPKTVSNFDELVSYFR